MTDLGHLTYLSHSELGKTGDWAADAQRCVDIAYTKPQDEAEMLERQNRITYVGDFIGKVVARPLEPVVFYRPGIHEAVSDDQFYLFDVVTPDPNKPIEFMSPSSNTERNAVLRLNPYTAAVGDVFKHDVSNAFQTSVDARQDSNIKVWFGIGAPSIRISPDKAFEEPNTQVAIGSEEVAQLFDGLRSDDSVRNGRLFGALFNIAWMAHDLGTVAPRIGSYEEERAAAQGAIHIQKSAAHSLVESSTEISHAMNIAIKEAEQQAIRSQVISDMYQSSIGDIYVQNLYRSRDVHDAVMNRNAPMIHALQNDISRNDATITKQKEAIESYDKQLTILDSMKK